MNQKSWRMACSSLSWSTLSKSQTVWTLKTILTENLFFAAVKSQSLPNFHMTAPSISNKKQQLVWALHLNAVKDWRTCVDWGHGGADMSATNASLFCGSKADYNRWTYALSSGVWSMRSQAVITMAIRFGRDMQQGRSEHAGRMSIICEASLF